MLFSDVLDVHKSFAQEGCLKDVLGDGFLLGSNPIYKNIRAFSLQIGCKYVEAYPRYLLLPFQELPQIVKSKEIPYVPAARLMEEVDSSRPGVFSIEDMPMPESYHLHEAAHVIAEHFLQKIKTNGHQEQILKSILAESFANSVDALACMYVADEFHYFFLKQNGYMQPQEEIVQAMASITDSLGFRFTFMLTFFTYVHANFLTSPLSEKSVDDLVKKYASSKTIDRDLKADIQTVCAIGEKLDPLFRISTTGNYFKQQGFEGNVQDLLDFPFMNVFASKPELMEAVEAFGSTVT